MAVGHLGRPEVAEHAAAPRPSPRRRAGRRPISDQVAGPDQVIAARAALLLLVAPRLAPGGREAGDDRARDALGVVGLQDGRADPVEVAAPAAAGRLRGGQRLLPVLPAADVFRPEVVEVVHQAGEGPVAGLGGAAAERVVAFLGAGALAALALFVCFTTGFGLFYFLPDLLGSYRDALETAGRLISGSRRMPPPDANVFAYDDPLMYLYSGRKSCNLPIPPKFFYHNDDAGIDKLLHSIPDFARQYQISSYC